MKRRSAIVPRGHVSARFPKKIKNKSDKMRRRNLAIRSVFNEDVAPVDGKTRRENGGREGLQWSSRMIY